MLYGQSKRSYARKWEYEILYIAQLNNWNSRCRTAKEQTILSPLLLSMYDFILHKWTARVCGCWLQDKTHWTWHLSPSNSFLFLPSFCLYEIVRYFFLSLWSTVSHTARVPPNTIMKNIDLYINFNFEPPQNQTISEMCSFKLNKKK